MLSTEFDYPSQAAGLRVPDGPILLVTCVIQNLLTLGRYGEDGRLTDRGEERLRARYGDRHTDELVALDLLVGRYRRNGSPWVVSESSLIELERMTGPKGQELRRWWFEWAAYFDSCLDADWYPEVNPDGLVISRGPDVSDHQLALFIAPEPVPLAAEPILLFGPFRDKGDCALVRDARRAGILTILTTDLKSFWANRRVLYSFGIEIWRPTDVWRTIAGDHVAEDGCRPAAFA